MSVNGKAEGEIGSKQKYFGMSVRGIINIE